MLHYPDIPLILLRDLSCRHCKKFLSCGPIHTVPDGTTLCGRCYILANTNYRNHVYETIAKRFVYPCCYWSKYCSRILYWNESLEHERNCVYNTTVRLCCTHPTVLFRAERKIPDSTVKLVDILRDDGILEQLKCVNCDCYLSCDPVYICNDGKNICHRCINSNGIPQYCIRNLSYERLANLVIFPCSYRHRGCPIRMRYGRDLWQHETECSYGQINKKPVKRSSSSRNGGGGGKERGVIQTHSGHVYGTLTPHTALFAPPPRPHHNHHQHQDPDTQSLQSSVYDEGLNESRSSRNSFNLHLYHYPAFYMVEHNNRTVQREDSLNREVFDELKARQMQRQNESIYNSNNL